MKRMFLLMMCFLTLISMADGYMLPQKQIVDMVDEKPEPFITTKVNSGMYAEVYYNAMPAIEDLTNPLVKLGGKRIDPQNYSEHSTFYYTNFKFYQKDGTPVIISGIPENIKIADYSWEYSGKYMAFTVKREDSVDLWIIDFENKKAKRLIPNVSAVLNEGFIWVKDNPDKIIANVVAYKHKKKPVKDKSLIKPIIQQSFGKAAKVRTYQDLLKDKYDEELFEYYFSSIITVVDIKTGKKKYISKPGIFWLNSTSPDGTKLLITEYKQPFSYSVPYYYYSRAAKVIDINTSKEIVLKEYGVSDSIPVGGVYKGKRYFNWVPYYNSTLMCAEALDEGNPKNDVPFRDKIYISEYPYKKYKEVAKLQHRYYGYGWFQNKPGKGMISDYDWKKRWVNTYWFDISKKEAKGDIIESISVNDEYNSMGEPVEFRDKKGNDVIIYDEGFIYTKGKGATKKGYFPFLRRVDLNTLKKEELFRCPQNKYERFLAFTDSSFSKALLKSESNTEYPNYYIIDLKTGKKTQKTFFKNPIPFLKDVKKEIIKYSREDDVPLSGTLYLPVNYKEGQKVPVVLHAYPLEYSSKKTAGQVRSSGNTFTKISYMSELFFLLQGVAVFKNAQFPVVGDPETMNDTFIEQLKLNAQAAIKALDNTGKIDVSKAACIGHSYGAFMVANLLIHTDLFKTGIAQSGAYNRTLTPFGFQSERRSFWEAKDTYINVSPFMHVEKLDEPILLVHGENDNNPGTYTMQSDRLYSAIKGNGGKVRYLKLPYESHGYSARESILHLLYERYNWIEEYLKK